MKCAKCGKRIKKDDQFCGFCGALVVREHKGKVWTKRILLFVMLLIILAVGCVYAVKKYFSNQHISVYSNGDRVYHPQSDHISWDQETGILYYDNLVTVYLKDNISNREEKELAKQIDGKIVTRIHGGVDLIQIKIETADYKKIIDYVSKLKESKYVQNAFYEAPWLDVESYKNKTKEDQNPWSEDGKTIEGKNGDCLFCLYLRYHGRMETTGGQKKLALIQRGNMWIRIRMICQKLRLELLTMDLIQNMRIYKIQKTVTKYIH